MDEPSRIELIRLLAKFKLQVRRQLNQTVDLYQLENDVAYARDRLSEIEDEADDEELLVMVLHLRELLVPRSAPTITSAHPITASAPEKRYLFGARS